MLPNFIKIKLNKKNPVIARAKPAYQAGGPVAIQKSSRFKSGFSLFELLVVISIMIMVTAVSFSSYPKMNNRLSLDLTTQDIALTIRQAQVFGTTVFGVENTGQTSLSAYGVSFPVVNPATDYVYILFGDKGISNPTNSFYNNCDSGTPESDICINRFNVGGKEFIKGYCYNFDELADDKKISCLFKNQLNSFDVRFIRPSLEADFAGELLDGSGSTSEHWNNVAIVIESESSGEKRAIIVWKTGQISIEP